MKTHLEDTMPYLVTIKPGLVDISLPGGQMAQGGQIALLSDDEYAMLSPTAAGTLFSSVTVPTAGQTPTTTVTPFRPVYTAGHGPYVEDDNEPSSTTTPDDSPSIG